MFDISKQINHAYSHNEDGTCLSEGIAHESHQQGEDSTAEQTHNHQSADLVLLLRHGSERLGKADAEYVRVAVTNKGNSCIEFPLLDTDEEQQHGERHHTYADDEEQAVVHDAQEERACQTTDGTEDEI